MGVCARIGWRSALILIPRAQPRMFRSDRAVYTVMPFLAMLFVNANLFGHTHLLNRGLRLCSGQCRYVSKSRPTYHLPPVPRRPQIDEKACLAALPGCEALVLKHCLRTYSFPPKEKDESRGDNASEVPISQKMVLGRRREGEGGKSRRFVLSILSQLE